VGAVLVHDAAKVVVVVNLLDFGDLKDDAGEREVDRLGHVECAFEALFRFVDGVGIEVDAEVRGGVKDAQRGGDGDGLLAAALVDGVAIVVQGVVKYARGGFAPGTARQRFVGDDRALSDIDDGLEGHGERDVGTGVADLAALAVVGGVEAVIGVADGGFLLLEDV
jgi:hypothetical protein